MYSVSNPKGSTLQEKYITVSSADLQPSWIITKLFATEFTNTLPSPAH